MIEIVNVILDFVRQINVFDLWFKLIILCFIHAFICEGIDTIKGFIKFLTVAKYNYYTTKFQDKVEEKQVVPYVKNDVVTGEIVDISNLVSIIPKLMVNIDIATGKIQQKEVWKKRGLFERFIHPKYQGMAKCINTEIEMRKVKKFFVYTQSLINTLNLNYPNWQELNPSLKSILKSDQIVAEEVIFPHLQKFQK